MKKIIFTILLGVLASAFPMNVNAEGSLSTSASQVRGISVYERGVLRLNGDVNDYGIGYYGHGVAKGILNLNYYAQYGLGAGIDDQTYYVLKLPQEFEKFSSFSEFKKSITGRYTQKAVGIPLKKYDYMQQDITIENNTVIFKNPRFSYIVEARILVDLKIDLGKFVTISGIHIPDNEDNNGYRFMGTNVQNRNLLNWSIFSGTDADRRTNTRVFDFMYALSR